jgi:hypothetical protein
MKQKRWWLVILAAFLSGCSQFGWRGEPKPAEKKTETVLYREDFDPLTLNEEDVKVQARAGANAGQAETRSIVTPKTERTQSSGGETAQGFRVQLMATTDRNQALEIKKNAMLKLRDKIHLVYDPPHYKIRVGDCQTREQAKTIQEEAQANGFPDAWIVPSKIYRQGSAMDDE